MLLPPMADVRLFPPASRLGSLAFSQEKHCFNID